MHEDGYSDLFVNEDKIEAEHPYHIKVIANGSQIKIYIDDSLLADIDSPLLIPEYLGLNVCAAKGTFQNVYYERL